MAPASMCGRATRAQSAAARVLSPPGPDPIRPRRKRGEEVAYSCRAVGAPCRVVAFNTQRAEPSQAQTLTLSVPYTRWVYLIKDVALAMQLAHPLLDPLHAIEGAETVEDAAAGVLVQSSGSDSPTNAPLPTGTVQWSELDFPMPQEYSLD